MPRRNIAAVIKRELGNDVEFVGAEVGVQKGAHSKYLLDNLKIKKLFCVDLWGPYEQDGQKVDLSLDYKNAQLLLEKYPQAELIKGHSHDVAQQCEAGLLDFVYIDANHQYEHVLEELRRWTLKVKKGGLVCGHDYTAVNFPGVAKAVDQFVAETNRTVGQMGEDWFFKR